MKVVILCGGLGMRLREETEFRPKPMVDVGGRPILWHIMRHYSRYGHNEFVLCLGYKGEVIRDYFLNFRAMKTDIRLDLGTQKVEYLNGLKEERDWKVTLADTGPDSATGERLLRASRYFSGQTFLCSYGDGVSNVDIGKLMDLHQRLGRLVTVTGVRPLSRFGELDVQDGIAVRFSEKPPLHEGWVSGGFFVIEPGALEYIHAGEFFEHGPLQRLAQDGQLAVYEHDGYWAAMDTYRDVVALNEEWASGRPGWMERT
ncbi:MAG: glucose-1-phosphate cytidylyltransferase [Elusimicrobia bacterium]|nr:glucose-1-phosphate cytidylyltransferase [Elusimicrobiota bacterium]